MKTNSQIAGVVLATLLIISMIGCDVEDDSSFYVETIGDKDENSISAPDKIFPGKTYFFEARLKNNTILSPCFGYCEWIMSGGSSNLTTFKSEVGSMTVFTLRYDAPRILPPTLWVALKRSGLSSVSYNLHFPDRVLINGVLIKEN